MFFICSKILIHVWKKQKGMKQKDKDKEHMEGFGTGEQTE